MPIDLKIENSGLVRKDGRTLLTNGYDELKQNVKNRLLTRQGEFFLDGTYGLDYDGVLPITSKILSKDTQKLTIRECISSDERILDVPVINISNVNKHREQTISFEADSIYGTLTEEGVIIG